MDCALLMCTASFTVYDYDCSSETLIDCILCISDCTRKMEKVEWSAFNDP